MTGEGLDEVAKVYNKHATKGSINDCDGSGWSPLHHAGDRHAYYVIVTLSLIHSQYQLAIPTHPLFINTSPLY